MIKRPLENKLKKSATQYPVVTLTGPRQSGKLPWFAQLSRITSMFHWKIRNFVLLPLRIRVVSCSNLGKMPVLAKFLNTDLSRGFTVSQVAEKHNWTEPMVWDNQICLHQCGLAGFSEQTSGGRKS